MGDTPRPPAGTSPCTLACVIPAEAGIQVGPRRATLHRGRGNRLRLVKATFHPLAPNSLSPSLPKRDSRELKIGGHPQTLGRDESPHSPSCVIPAEAGIHVVLHITRLDSSPHRWPSGTSALLPFPTLSARSCLAWQMLPYHSLRFKTRHAAFEEEGYSSSHPLK